MRIRRLAALAVFTLLVAASTLTSARAGTTAEDSSGTQATTPAQHGDETTPVPPTSQAAPTTPTQAAPARPVMTAGSISLGVNGGVELPFGDFSDQASTGFSMGLTGDYVVGENLAVGGELGWHSFGGSDDVEKKLSVQYGTPVNLTFRVVPITVHAKYFLPTGQTLTPFVKGALGIYNVLNRVEREGSSDVEHSSTRIGFQVGGGADFNTATSIRYGFDVLYHYIATENKATNILAVRGQLMFGVPRR